MSGFRIDIAGDARKVLNHVVAKAKHPKSVMAGIGDDLAAEIRLGFAAGEDPYGEAWAHPVFRSGQPLRDTGRLMNSITYHADDDSVEVGTNVCYAATHQFGALIAAQPGSPGSNACGPRKGAPYLVFKTPRGYIRTKSVTIPPRPFLPDEQRGLPTTWVTQIQNRVAQELGVA